MPNSLCLCLGNHGLYGVALHSRAVQCHCVQNNWECKVPSLLLWVISDKPTAGVIYGQASGVPSPPPPPPMVWSGTGWGGGGLACAERGGGRWSCSWRNGQASQTRPA